MNLETFLQSNLRNVWLAEQDISVYLRKGQHCVSGGTVKQCTDIANIEVNEPRRGTGVFTNFLSKVEAKAKEINHAVYVESVMYDRLSAFLLRRGYQQDSRTIDSPAPSFYKLSEQL